jgi:hypothetical protein
MSALVPEWESQGGNVDYEKGGADASRCQAKGEGDIADQSARWPLLVPITVGERTRRPEHFLAARRDVRREGGSANAKQAFIYQSPRRKRPACSLTRPK